MIRFDISVWQGMNINFAGLPVKIVRMEKSTSTLPDMHFNNIWSRSNVQQINFHHIIFSKLCRNAI